LPIIEAQACGVPVIVPNQTTGPELVGPGWLIDIDMVDDAVWTPAGVWRYYARPYKILAQMEQAFEAWKDARRWEDIQTRARWNACQYDWDRVWPEHFAPVVAELEKRLAGRVVAGQA
jgi:glycosyltransferase involved in cell wall biosynthesis